MNPFGVYVHWPYCAAKCPYCDFNSHVRMQVDEEAWVAAIIRELNWLRKAQGPHAPAVETVFFGGGTPSLMSGKSAGMILDAVGGLWTVTSNVEVTLEANPASADAVRFLDYRNAGINRVSLGIQALNGADLKFLGRLHDAAEAKISLRTAMDLFDRVSLDLIYARPGQSVAAWRAELAEALAFGTEHLSLYQLTVEPGTSFSRLERQGVLTIPGEEDAASLYELTQEMTEAAGRPAYEISNHAAPGAECRHNMIYWRYGDYAGAGPGAHSRLTLGGERVALSSERLPERWQANVARHGHGCAKRISVDAHDGARENLLMSLRLSEGLDLERFRTRWNARVDPERIDELVEAKLIRLEEGRLIATPRGRLVLNCVIAALAA